MGRRLSDGPGQDATTLLVTGGTGTLGRALVRAAADRYRVRILSRREAPPDLVPGREWARADLAGGEGLDEAVRGVDAVVHAATDPQGDPRGVDVGGTRRLLTSLRREGGAHLVFPSIVGVDRMPFAYYDAKVGAEELVAGSGLPHTIVRITQFHAFVSWILGRVARLPVMPLPTRARIQSIAVDEAARHLLDLVRSPPAGRAPDAGGPEVLTLGEMARSWCRARGKRRLVVRLPVPGGLARGFRQGRATTPGNRVGVETWEQWLRRSEDPPREGG